MVVNGDNLEVYLNTDITADGGVGSIQLDISGLAGTETVTFGSGRDNTGQYSSSFTGGKANVWSNVDFQFKDELTIQDNPSDNFIYILQPAQHGGAVHTVVVSADYVNTYQDSTSYYSQYYRFVTNTNIAYDPTQGDGMIPIKHDSSVPLITIDISNVAEGTTFSFNQVNCKLTKINLDSAKGYSNTSGYATSAARANGIFNDYRNITNSHAVTFGDDVLKPLSFLPSNKIRVIKSSNKVNVVLPQNSDLLNSYTYNDDGTNKGIGNVFELTFASALDETTFGSSKIANWTIGSFTMKAQLSTTDATKVDIATTGDDSGKIMLLAGEAYELITGYTGLPDITGVSINLDNGSGGFTAWTNSDSVVELDNGGVRISKTTNSVTVELPDNSNLLTSYTYNDDGTNKGIGNVFELTFASALDETTFGSSKIANWTIGSFTMKAQLSTTDATKVDIATTGDDSGKIMLLAGEAYELITGYTGLPDITGVSINLDNGSGGFIAFDLSDSIIILDKYAVGGAGALKQRNNVSITKRAVVTTGLGFLTTTTTTGAAQATALNADSVNQRTFCANAFKMALNGTALGLTLETKTTALAASKSDVLIYAEDHNAETQATTLNADSVNQRTFCANAFKMALNGNDIGISLDTIESSTPITKTAENLKVEYDGTDTYTVSLVPDSGGLIGSNSTVFACTAFTYSGDYNTSLQNIDTSAANTEALLSGTGTTTLLTNNHLCNGANTSTVLLADVQTGFDKLHRVTWFKTGETFTASTDYKIMQLKHTGTKLIGTLELYYGDGTNGDQKKYTVTFTDDATTIAVTGVAIANPPPFRKYYVDVDVVNSQYVFSDGDGSSFSAYTNPITIYKRATYIFELNAAITSHPFGIKEASAVTTSSTDLFKIQGGSTQNGQLGDFNNIIQNKGDKLLMFTTENYSGSATNIKYYCVNHALMEQSFALTPQKTPAGYDALVDADRHIEIGHNIRLEIEGEEIIL